MAIFARLKNAYRGFRHAVNFAPDIQIGPERQVLALQRGPEYSQWLHEQFFGERSSAIPAISRAKAVLVNSLLQTEMRVVQETDDPSAAQPIDSHPINQFLRSPSRISSGPVFWRDFFQCYTGGNSYAFVRRTPEGLPIELVPVTCQKSEAVGNPVSRRGVHIRHYLQPMVGDSFPDREYWGDLHVVRVHWADTYQPKSLKSLSPIAGYASQVVGNNQLLQSHYQKRLSRPMPSSAAIEMDASLIDRYKQMSLEAFIEAAQQFGDDVAEWLKRDKVVTLPPGFKVSNNIDDLDLKAIDLLDLTVDEIARVYGVPPAFLYRYAVQSFRHLEQENSAFTRRSITSHAQIIGGELTRKLLTVDEQYGERLRVELNTTRLELGTMTERIAAAVALTADGGLGTVNEGRDLLDLAPVEDGDQRFAPRGGPMTRTPQDGVEPQQTAPYITTQNGNGEHALSRT